MSYLLENVCNTITMLPLPGPLSWEEVEATLILGDKIEKEGESQVLKRYFELGRWLEYAKIFIKRVNFVLDMGNHFGVGLEIRQFYQRAICQS